MERVKKILKYVLSWGRNGVIGVLAVFGLLIVVMIGVAWGEDYYEKNLKGPYDDWTNKREVSNDVSFIEKGSRGGYLYNHENDKKTIRNLRWVVTSADEDSLGVFAKGDKRGYFNTKTGEEVLPAEYDRAWVFSEGIAAVVKNGKLIFIDPKGNKVFDREFKRYGNADDHVYHGGYCTIRDYDSRLLGLIDRKGNNVLPFEYRRIQHADNNLWIVWKDGKVGLLDSALTMMIPFEYKDIMVTKREGIYVVDHENICHLLDFDGKTVLRNRVIANVMRLEYEDENLDEGYHSVTRQAACFIYTCDMHMPIHYGLMSRSGQILTKPVYESIEAVTHDLYLCQPGGVLVDCNGEER